MITAFLIFIATLQLNVQTTPLPENFQGRITFEVPSKEGGVNHVISHYGEKIIREERLGELANLNYGGYSDFYYHFDSTTSWGYSRIKDTWIAFDENKSLKPNHTIYRDTSAKTQIICGYECIPFKDISQRESEFGLTIMEDRIWVTEELFFNPGDSYQSGTGVLFKNSNRGIVLMIERKVTIINDMVGVQESSGVSRKAVKVEPIYPYDTFYKELQDYLDKK